MDKIVETRLGGTSSGPVTWAFFNSSFFIFSEHGRHFNGNNNKHNTKKSTRCCYDNRNRARGQRRSPIWVEMCLDTLPLKDCVMLPSCIDTYIEAQNLVSGNKAHTPNQAEPSFACYYHMNKGGEGTWCSVKACRLPPVNHGQPSTTRNFSFLHFTAKI